MLDNPEDIDLHPIADATSLSEPIPIIDVAEVVADSASPAALNAIDQISNACRTWGFFQIVNHGIDTQELEAVWRQAHALFALPCAVKNEMLRSKTNPWGFYNRELTKNQRDKKEVFDFTGQDIDPIYGQSNRWPEQNANFKSTMLSYLASCKALALNLLEAFCIGLGLPARFLHSHFQDNHTGFARLNYYPVHDPLASLITEALQIADLGIHNHTDAGALTVLLQDQTDGLQVYRDGWWHDVPPLEGALTVNTGDMMQVWSNDIYQAAIHRVLAMDKSERYSVPFFLNPAADCQIRPLPSVVSTKNPSRYHVINWGDFRGQRSDGDFADYGKEVQISQYRI